MKTKKVKIIIYEILSIADGKETVLLTTSDKGRAQQEYYRTECCRLRIDGKTLPICEADRIMSRSKDGKNDSAWRYGYQKDLV